MLDRSNLFRQFGFDLSLAFQQTCIISQFLAPVGTGTVRILIGQFKATAVLFVSIQRISIKFATSRSVHIDPHREMIPFVISQFHIVMATFQHTDDFAGRSMIFVGSHHIHIRFRSLPVYVRMEGQVTLLEITRTAPVGYTDRGRIFKVRPAGFASIMASHTGTVENRLYLIFKGIRTDTTIGNLQFMRLTGRCSNPFRNRNGVLIFMAAHTGYHFARHTGQPATHPLYGTSVRIERLEGDRRIGRNLKDSRAILFYRNGSQQTLDIPSGLDTVIIMVGQRSAISIFIRIDTE